MTVLEDNNKDNNITINPNTSGYIDRKMAKWQGLILSEHIEKVIESEKVSKKNIIQKEKQPSENIYELIDYSYSQKKTIAIQMDLLFNGKYEEDIIGVVCGFFQEYIYIQKNDSDVVICDLGLIRNIEEYALMKWFKV